jgi:hypothetical protein
MYIAHICQCLERSVAIATHCLSNPRLRQRGGGTGVCTSGGCRLLLKAVMLLLLLLQYSGGEVGITLLFLGQATHYFILPVKSFDTCRLE